MHGSPYPFQRSRKYKYLGILFFSYMVNEKTFINTQKYTFWLVMKFNISSSPFSSPRLLCLIRRMEGTLRQPEWNIKTVSPDRRGRVRRTPKPVTKKRCEREARGRRNDWGEGTGSGLYVSKRLPDRGVGREDRNRYTITSEKVRVTRTVQRCMVSL